MTPIPGDLCAFWFTAEELEAMAAAAQDMWLNGFARERLRLSRLAR